MVDIDLCAPHAYIGPQHGHGASSRGVDTGDGHVQRERERPSDGDRDGDGDGDEDDGTLRQHVKGGRGRFNRFARTRDEDWSGQHRYRFGLERSLRWTLSWATRAAGGTIQSTFLT